MKFRDWRVKKVINGAEELLERIGTKSDISPEELKKRARATSAYDEDDPQWDKNQKRVIEIGHRIGELKILRGEIEEKIDSLRAEMGDNDEMEAKYAHVYQALRTKMDDLYKQQEDLERERNSIESGARDMEKVAGPEKPKDLKEPEEEDVRVKDETPEEAKEKVQNAIEYHESYLKKAEDNLKTASTETAKATQKQAIDYHTKMLEKRKKELEDMQK
jgi:hypothetical protein